MKRTLFFVVTSSSVTELYNTRKSSRKERNTKLPQCKVKVSFWRHLLRQLVKVRMADIQSLWKRL